MVCLERLLMGELMKQLEAKGTYLARGNPCFIQRIRDNEGEARARDVWEVVVAPRFPTSKKIELLRENGYQVSEQVIRRHARQSCQGCATWLS